MRDFNHTVNVLVKAYLNDTLQRGNCYACAVGNMVAEACGYKLSKLEYYITWINPVTECHQDSWWLTAITNKSGLCIGEDDENNVALGLEEIDSTGYTLEELSRIEKAFELRSGLLQNLESKHGKLSLQERIFHGLMAVIDQLADIHQVDISVREESKLLFIKQ